MQLDMPAVYAAGGVEAAPLAAMPTGAAQGGLVWTPSMQRMFTLVRACVPWPLLGSEWEQAMQC